jgi:hypothetical protein
MKGLLCSSCKNCKIHLNKLEYIRLPKVQQQRLGGVAAPAMAVIEMELNYGI